MLCRMAVKLGGVLDRWNAIGIRFDELGLCEEVRWNHTVAMKAQEYYRALTKAAQDDIHGKAIDAASMEYLAELVTALTGAADYG